MNDETRDTQNIDALRDIVGASGLRDDANSVEIEDVIANGFRDVTADDWARLPEDLTERLDDYLYGRGRA
ncbi:MAG: hypothetical protein F4Y47_12065 [Acidobacteriia bacterium]|nr:hypothetical protein [Terriglobia bacterium]MYG02731.1 hypothetical protein [Terriglobia bacterium]MYK10225.1 hypothetical protein [Terriglobia bacterium]